VVKLRSRYHSTVPRKTCPCIFVALLIRSAAERVFEAKLNATVLTLARDSMEPRQ
jgi:hypothetical protein